MLQIAIVLTNNKSDEENIAQIEFFKPLIEKQIEYHPEVTDPRGKVYEAYDTYYYTIKGFVLPHEVHFYQIFPFSVKLPANKDDIDSYKVYYGAGDEDKTGDHSRFYNWGLKRATDYGAEIVVHVDNYKDFSVDDLPFKVNTLVDPVDTTDLIDEISGKYSTVRLLRRVGQVDEAMSLSQSIATFKNKILEKELSYG